MFGLSGSLLFALILFLSGIEATSNTTVCKAVALLLHFFLLSMFGWMAAHALLAYYKLVDIFGKGRNINRITFVLCVGRYKK